MKDVFIMVIAVFLTAMGTLNACECIDGEVIEWEYYFLEDLGAKTVILQLRDYTDVASIQYRKVYWTEDQRGLDSLVGYVRMDSLCEKMFYLCHKQRREELIYNIGMDVYPDFRIPFRDKVGREFYLYYGMHQRETIDNRRIVELKGPKLRAKASGNLKFIEGVGPNCLYFLSPNDIDCVNLGFNGVLVRKSTDGVISYEQNKRDFRAKGSYEYVYKTKYLTSKDRKRYEGMLDMSYDQIYNEISSYQDVFLLLDELNWEEHIEFIDRLIDHPLCDKGCAMKVFWGNVPNHYISDEYRKDGRRDKGFEINLKLYQRLYLNYYKVEENYFHPGVFKYSDLEDILKIPLELTLPVPGTVYEYLKY